MNPPALAPAPHPSMQSTDQDDQVLHDQLLAAQVSHNHQGGGLQHHHMGPPATASPRHQPNIDPAISGAAMMGAVAPQTPAQPQHQGSSDDGNKGVGGKRELSTSKRAAQNRAAQRAFRQRKETYIRKLEDEIKLVENYKETIAKLSSENFSLRDYVILLQSRLMESQIEVPELPANIDLTQQPRHDLGLGMGGNIQQGQQPGSVGDDMNQLNRIAVAGLGVRGRDETNFMGTNFNKRQRSDDGTTDPDLVAKQEPQHPHGLPMA